MIANSASGGARMPSEKQKLGEKGERLVTKICACPRCKRERTLRQLRANFKCADIICDFCGYLAQVKASNVLDIDKLPREIPGAAWSPQKQRMDSGIYFPLFITLFCGRKKAIYYLPADLQPKALFKKRGKPLSPRAKRGGWLGFNYDLASVPKGAIVRLL
jgi:hypothetical protein